MSYIYQEAMIQRLANYVFDNSLNTWQYKFKTIDKFNRVFEVK